MTYHVTIEVRTPKTLDDRQQNWLSNAILEALDKADPKIPYGADAVTATVSVE